MKIRVRASYTVLLLSLLCGSNALASENFDWDQPDLLPPMREMELQWVGEKMRYNGVPSSMRLFSTRQPPDEVDEYYSNWFSRRGSEHVARSEVDGFTVLGAQIKDTFYSVRFKDLDGETVGSLASNIVPRSKLEWSQNSVEPIFQFSGSATLENRVESIDGKVYSDVSTYDFSLPKTFVSNWMIRTLKEDGWRYLGGHGETATKHMFQRNSEHAEVAIIDHPSGDSGRSVVNVIWVKE